MFDRVLVSLDLSPATEALVSALPGLADLGTREIILGHIVKEPSFLSPERLMSQEIGTKHDIRRRLNSLAENLEARGFSTSVRVTAGGPATEITRIAGEHAADVIMVGTRSHTRLYEAFIGSVAWEILRRARRPVLMQRIEPNRLDPEAALETRASGLPNRVIHATDFSPTAERAAPWLKRLAELGVAEFTLLHATDDEGVARTEAGNRLEAFAAELRAAGAGKVNIEIRGGSPAEIVLNQGGRNPHNMVVIGTRGRGNIPEIVLGSESRQVVRQAAASILLVPSISGDSEGNSGT
jgi:nucleotide-binding universal stress UspA family protein